ncbi:MAG TPA: HEAT repeat domain-containing protein [Thermoanaerobaculia bacterium]|nr:HEAT repeat domain-containing protein [Thermoanaerobaculia bacterium]
MTAPIEPGVPSATDVPKESPRTILVQFVLLPLGVVLVGVAVFLLFGKLASEEHSIPDYVNEIRSGGRHERWQAAYQLSKSIQRGEAKKYPDLEPQIAAIYGQSKNDDPRIRRYLSMVLGQLGDRRATPLLLDALGDRDVETRLYALLALGQLRDPAALPRLQQAAADEDKDVRKTALYALGEMGDSRAVPTLAAALTDQTPDVRWNAAVALSGFGDKRALSAVHEMLDRSHLDQIAGMRDDQKEDVMISGMTALLKLAGRDSIPDLQRIANSDKSLRVRDAARSAVASLK